jgi:signal transduction histidine kinase
LSHTDPAAFKAVLAALPDRASHWKHGTIVLAAARNVHSLADIQSGNAGDLIGAWELGLRDIDPAGLPSLLACYLTHFARVLLHEGRVAEGLDLCERGLDFLQFAPHERTQSQLAMLVPTAYGQLGLHDEAIRLHKRAEQLHVTLGFVKETFRASNLNNYAVAHVVIQRAQLRRTGQVDRSACEQAADLASVALDLVQRDGHPVVAEMLPRVLETLVRVYVLLGEIDRASGCFRRIDALLGASAPRAAQARSVVLGRAHLALALGQPSSALRHLEDARQATLSGSFDYACVEWWEAHAATMQALGRWEDAYRSMEQCNHTMFRLAGLRAQAVAQAASRRVDRMNTAALQFLTHDIRMPVSNMAALARSAPAEQPQENLERISSLADEVLRMAGRSIDYMHASLAHEADFRPVDLMIVLDDACEDTQAVAAEKQLELVRRIEGPAWVLGDASLLRRCFTNLLSNAVRFSPPQGSITVRLVLDAGCWVVEIIDCGPGFKAAQSAAQPEVKRLSRQGYGLGLAFVSHTMIKHNATLRLLENEPHGARVCIVFMCVDDHGGKGTDAER